MAGVPFKVFIPCNNVKVGMVARSLEHLQSLLKDPKFGLSGPLNIALEDGTLLQNEEYFNLLEPQTTLVVQQSSSGSTGIKQLARLSSYPVPYLGTRLVARLASCMHGPSWAAAFLCAFLAAAVSSM